MGWSPFSEASLNDHASEYSEILSACPVHLTDSFDPPFYTLSQYADVTAALRDVHTFSSEYGQGPRFTQPVGMLCDAPQHSFFRHIVQPNFTPKVIAALEPQVLSLTEDLVATIEEQPGCDFDLHDDLAFPLPVTIIAELLRVPVADLVKFKHWSDIQVAAMGAQDPSQYAQDQADFQRYMRSHLQAERSRISAGTTSDEPDLLYNLASAEDEQGLVDEEQILSVLNQLLVGGNETTTSLITNALWRLLEHREHWQALCRDPSLAPAVIEESLRFDPPVLGLYRNTTTGVTVAGSHIPAGSKVLLNYAAANRDPEVFAAPNEFNPTRRQPKHLAFGLGVHFCLGAPMARLEATIALQVLAQRLPTLELTGPGERITPFFLWGRRKLPVSY